MATSLINKLLDSFITAGSLSSLAVNQTTNLNHFANQPALGEGEGGGGGSDNGNVDSSTG